MVQTLTREQQQAVDYLVHTDFRHFVRKVFSALEPSEFMDNWHLDYLCHLATTTFPEHLAHLKPTTAKDLTNTHLIINVPPRTLKSIIWSVALPAFLMGHDPSLKFLCASYSQAMAGRLNTWFRRVVTSQWYQRVFPQFQIKKDTEVEIVTTKGGSKWAVGVGGGSATGDGADFIIADDLMNPKMAGSDAERNAANEYYDNTLYNRTRQANYARRIVVMQRLHQDDLTGHLLAKNAELPERFRYRHIVLPAIAQDTKTYKFYGQAHTFREGDLLHPLILSHEVLQAQRASLSSVYEYAGQYLQQPSPDGGGDISVDWFQYYDNLPPEAEQVHTVHSWDTATTTKSYSDYSVCIVFVSTKNGYYVKHLFRQKMQYPELKRKTKQIAQAIPPTALLIEHKGSGITLVQDLQQETLLPVKKIVPKVDKITRARQVASTIEAGKVYLPLHAPWIGDFLQEVAMFPNGRHDDQVDALSQGLEWLQRYADAQFRIRSL